eukprot:9200117-Alexandrium_andersonii.AAC.1
MRPDGARRRPPDFLTDAPEHGSSLPGGPLLGKKLHFWRARGASRGVSQSCLLYTSDAADDM